MTHLTEILEAVLFVSGKQLEIELLAEKLEVTQIEISKALEELKEKYSQNSGINVMFFNGKAQLCSNPQYSKQVEAVLNPIREKELSNAMLETLAIIAYKQPITRLEIEEIRGVDCTYSIQCLLKTEMIVPLGRKDAIGKPILFGTTDEFLKRFSLHNVSDLPEYEVFIERLQSITTSQATQAQVVEVNMFDTTQNEMDIPDFLQGEEDLQIID
ncbi:MAG: SMC-Scp complex subunit ScpB [Clostridia bacterium]|nr:SMC-Scp complex subunit ScpB [Clostridia bacterium]